MAKRITLSRRFGYSLFAVILAVLGFAAYHWLIPGEETESSVASEISSSVPVTLPQDSSSSSGFAATSQSQTHPLDPMIELARSILNDMEANLQDYTATLVKRERIGGRLGDEAKLAIKIRNRSEKEDVARGLAIYMKFVSPKGSAGQEVIWVENENDNKLISHLTGFKNWRRIVVDPDGMLAMMGNKYPITEAGLNRLVEKLIEKGEEDRVKGPCKVDLIDGQKIGGRECQLIQVTHPTKSDQYDFHIAQIFIDTERKIPLRYAAFMWPESPGDEPPLEEEYTFLDVKVNVGLDDSVFDPDNPSYEFP